MNADCICGQGQPYNHSQVVNRILTRETDSRVCIRVKTVEWDKPKGTHDSEHTLVRNA
jgi:hypothetical protein